AQWAAPPLDLLTPDARPTTPAAAVRPATAHNLPSSVTSFIGRSAELGEIARRLTRGRRWERLLTLTGPGGVGKTRLALEVATQVIPEFPAGVWLVDLSAFHDP